MSEFEPHPTPGFEWTDRSRLQGLLTTGYGHLTHTAYLFLRLVNARRARAWLGDLLQRGVVTTARSWRARPGDPKVKPERAVNLAFTHAGLHRWGLDDETLHGFPPEFVAGPASDVTARSMGDEVDSAPRHWEFAGRKSGMMDVAVLVHASTEAERGRVLAELHESLDRRARGALTPVAAIQLGRHLVHLDPVSGRRIVKEHFGFRDGISQPELRGLKRGPASRNGAGQNTTAPGEFILGYPDEYGFYPPTPLTRRDRDPDGSLPESPYRSRFPGYVDFGYNGSYLVYRKLGQDVAGFWGFLREQAERLSGWLDPGAMLWLAAKMVGRWPNGVPLVEAPNLVDMTRHSGPLNGFQYAKADPDGARCPFASHVRRANPRDSIRPGSAEQSLRMSARHRILRRGSSFGEPLFDLSVLDDPADREALKVLRSLQDDGQARGLHFLCLNSSIRRQFEFVQQSWCASGAFNGLRGEPDPLIGSIGGGGSASFTIPGCPGGIGMTLLSRFTQTRAAAYLFVPGMDTLRYLARLRGR